MAALDKIAPRLEDGSYFVDQGGTLRAVDLGTGAERWAKKPPFTPRLLAGTELGPVLVDANLGATKDQIAVYDSGGAAKSISLPGRVLHLAGRARDALLVEDFDRIQRIDLAKGTATLFATLPFKVFGWHSALQVLPDGRSVCAISAPSSALEIACFDGDGAPTVRKTVDLHEPSDPKGMSFTIRSVDERYVLYGVGPFFLPTATMRAVAVRLSDGAVVAKVPENIAAIAEREDGSIEGLVAVQPDLRFIEIGGKTRWKVPSPAPHDEGASAIARGGKLFVDIYPPISSGSALLALDLGTGATLWHGDVHMLPIAHSEYFNEVRLSFAAGRVVLRGDESSVQTFQLFDEATGKRAFFDSRQPW